MYNICTYKIWAANGNKSVIAAVIFLFSSILIQINIFGHVKENPKKGEAQPKNKKIWTIPLRK
jgi:hypothetical protein